MAPAYLEARLGQRIGLLRAEMASILLCSEDGSVALRRHARDYRLVVLRLLSETLRYPDLCQKSYLHVCLKSTCPRFLGPFSVSALFYVFILPGNTGSASGRWHALAECIEFLSPATDTRGGGVSSS